MLCNIFLAQYPIKGNAKLLAVKVLRLNTLSSIKTAFLPPKRYDQYLYPICMGDPTQG